MFARNSYVRKLSHLIDLQVALANRATASALNEETSHRETRRISLHRPLAAVRRLANRVQRKPP